MTEASEFLESDLQRGLQVVEEQFQHLDRKIGKDDLGALLTVRSDCKAISSSYSIADTTDLPAVQGR